MMGQSQEDIVIGLRIEMQQAGESIANIKSRLKTMTSEVQSAMAGVQNSPFSPRTQEALSEAMGRQEGMYRELAVAQESLTRTSARLDRTMGKVPFAGYAMSLMFAGMALQRLFSSLSRFGTKAFQDTMHSVEGTVTQFDMLQASTQYLGFTIGQALEPVISFIIPIIDSVSNWISENQALAAGILITVGVLGTLLAVGGALKLAIDGFAGAFGILGVNASAAGSSLAAVFTGPWGIALAAAAVSAALIAEAFKETPEAGRAAKDTFASLKTVVSSLGDSLKDFLVALFDTEVNWEAIAWASAWLFDIWASGFKGSIAWISAAIHALAGLVNSLKAVVYAWQAVGEAMVPGGKDGSDSIAKAVKQTQEAVSNFNKIGTDLQKSAEGFDDAWTKLLTTTPEQYRALKEAEQLTKDMQAAVAGTTPQFVNPVTGLINYDALLTGRPASAASQPTQMVFNIQSLNVQADDPRSLANQFFDVNYRVSSLSK